MLTKHIFKPQADFLISWAECSWSEKCWESASRTHDKTLALYFGRRSWSDTSKHADRVVHKTEIKSKMCLSQMEYNSKIKTDQICSVHTIMFLNVYTVNKRFCVLCKTRTKTHILKSKSRNDVLKTLIIPLQLREGRRKLPFTCI